MKPGSLTLFTPDQPSCASADQLPSILREVGLTGDPLSADGNELTAGKRFLQLVTFLGCSPHVRLAPNSAGDDFCFIQLDGPSTMPRLVFGSNTRPPRCPECHSELDSWRSKLCITASTMPPDTTCPDCLTQIPARQLNWRQQAGLGCYFIHIQGVFPGEAVPSDELIYALQGAGGEWNYCYLQQPGAVPMHNA